MAVLVSDSFNRANSTTTMGSTDSASGGTAKTWTIRGIASNYGISTNQAYQVSGSVDDQAATVNAGNSNVSVTATFANHTGSPLMALRVSPASTVTYLSLQSAGVGTPYVLYDYTGSAWTQLATFGSGVDGDVLKVTLNGTDIKIFLNGTQVAGSPTTAAVTSTRNQTSTLFGFNMQGGGASRFDNFIIEDLAAGGTGTPGSVSYATKQVINRTASTPYATKQVINTTASTAYATKQTLFQTGATAFATQQTITSGGVPGSVSYATKQVVYQVSSQAYATKQAINRIASTAYATKQAIFQTGTLVLATKQTIYRVASIAHAVRQIIYQIGSLAFATQQTITNGGIPGSAAYATKQVLFQVSSVALATKQSIYQNASLAVATKQSIYQNGAIIVATRQVINRTGAFDAATKQVLFQAGSLAAATKQSIFRSGSLSFATLQRIVDGLLQIIDKTPLTAQRTLYVYLTGQRELTTPLRGDRQLTVPLRGEITVPAIQDLEIYIGESKIIPVTATDRGVPINLASATVKYVIRRSLATITNDISKQTGSGIVITDAAAGVCEITLDPADTRLLKPGHYYHEVQIIDSVGHANPVIVGDVTAVASAF